MAPRKRAGLGRPASGLPRYYMDTGWWRSRRFAGLPLDSIGLMQCIVSHGTEHATDGHVPADPEDLAAAVGLRAREVRKALKPLVDRGILTRIGSGIGSEFVVDGWAEHNPTKAEVEAMTDERSSLGKSGNHKRWHVDRGVIEPTCSLCMQGERTDSDGAATASRDPGSDPVSDRSSDPASDPVGDRPSDPKAIAKRSHGMGWDGKTPLPPTSQRRSPRRAGRPEGEDLPPDGAAEDAVDLPVSYVRCELGRRAGHLVHRTGRADDDRRRLFTLMAHTDAWRREQEGETIRNRTRWIATTAEGYAESLTAKANHLLTEHPTWWLDHIAEQMTDDGRYGPLDGGTHRAAERDRLEAQRRALDDQATTEIADAIAADPDATRRGAALARAALGAHTTGGPT